MRKASEAESVEVTAAGDEPWAMFSFAASSCAYSLFTPFEAFRSHVAEAFVTAAQKVNEQPGAEQPIDAGACATVQPSEPVASALESVACVDERRARVQHGGRFAESVRGGAGELRAIGQRGRRGIRAAGRA